MSIKKRMMLSNIIVLMIPVAAALIVWTLHSLKNTDRQAVSLADVQGVIYTFHQQAEQIDWENAFNISETDSEMILSEQEKIIQELSDMGYHIKAEKNGEVVYSDFDKDDERAAQSIFFSKGYAEYGNGYIISDKIRDLSVTAVYDPDRADGGTVDSLLPVYMLSASEILLLLLILAFFVTAVIPILSRRLEKAVAEKIDQLCGYAKHIEQGDIDFEVGETSDDEFKAVFLAFEKMKNNLRALKTEREYFEKYRTELLRGVSHDIRSPLTSIKGYTEGLRDGIANTDEKREKYYRAILTRTADLERLTDSLSELIRIESPDFSYHFEKTDLCSFIYGFADSSTLYCEENSTSIDIHAGETIFVSLDRNEMQRVLTNLLENSVKHGKADNTHITITAESCEDTAVISFSDNGVGVPEEQLKMIFESFFRGDDSRTRPESGSGLGLAVVRHIITAHSGTVSAISDDGLEIRIILPLWSDDNEKNTDS